MNDPQFIIIHCTGVSFRQIPDQFYAVNRWHKQRQFPKSILGWYVGYHRLSSNGIEYKAREDNEVGAHCNQYRAGYPKSLNFFSLGYCIAFDGDREFPPKRDTDNLVKTVREWMARYNIPIENVLYHRNPTPWKTCPGSMISDGYFENLIKPPKTIHDPEQEIKAQKIKELHQLLDRLRALVVQLKALLGFK